MWTKLHITGTFLNNNNTYFNVSDSKYLIQNKKNTEIIGRRKTSFPKEIAENADLHKPVINKIMTTQGYYTEYNFVAPLSVVQTKNKSLAAIVWSILTIF